MVEAMLLAVGIFAAGIVLGAELNRRARLGRPVIGPFKRSKGEAPTERRVHPGEYKL